MSEYKIKELNSLAMQAMLDAGYKHSTAYGSNWYIWNHLSIRYGGDTIFKDNLIDEYCLEQFDKDIFSKSSNELIDCEKRYRTAFTNLRNYILNKSIVKFKPIISNRLSLKCEDILTKYLFHCELDNNSVTTLNNKRQRIHRFMLECDFDNISEAKVKAYLSKKIIIQSKITYTIDTRLIRRFLEFCVERNIISRDILIAWPISLSSISNKNIPSLYSIDEIKILLSSAENVVEDNHLRNISILNLIVYSGIRVSDVVNMKVSDVDWINNIITIIQHKTKKEIIIALLPEIGNTIIHYIKNERHIGVKELYTSENGKKLTSSYVSTIINNYFLNSRINIGSRHFGAHALRHSLATRLINTDKTFFEVANVLGHSDISSVHIYAKVDIVHLRKCILESLYND